MIDLGQLSQDELCALSIQIAATLAARTEAQRLRCGVTVASGNDEGEPFLIIGIRPQEGGAKS